MRAALLWPLSIVVAIAATALLIYCTPLRYTALVPPPAIHDVDPKVFYADYSVHPEKYIFIDVRQASAYNASHAKGAINIPLQNLYDQHAQLPMHGKVIALICSQGIASGVAYSYLQHFGFRNIIRIAGGTENWAIEGLPLEGNAVHQTATSTAVAPLISCNA